MRNDQPGWSRRDFLHRLTLSGTAGLLGLRAEPADAEPPPETRRIRLVQIAGVCVAPQYVAEELLKSEGFNDVQYVKFEATPYKGFASGEVDLSMAFVAPFIIQVDAGVPIVLLGGVHVGCYELFGTERVRAIRDLSGKMVAVPELGSPHHVFVASMAAYVGLDPSRDINFVTYPAAQSMQLLAERKIDALMGFPPIPQELRAKKIGHVVVNSGVDRPWSQYFCCIVASNREFVRKHPVATKRALRAVLKAANLCAAEPERAARVVADKGYRYDYALQTMKEISYARWREYDPEDAVRFYALRLHEAGMIKSGPQKIIAQGTDWRFLNELKKELKG
ncbi:MAG TPA: ABC transporter substrate-binding protein [Methylomirabilota bacterium]|jgi:NitT/TauT family transport system substrate-binding protein|nr:ABC transporter substrate-binding protein [Methylomirabilota bacterium]